VNNTGDFKARKQNIIDTRYHKVQRYSFAGNFDITSIEENRKTANNILVFSDDFGLGGGTTAVDAVMNPEFKYSVTGTFDNATKVLNFEGERITS
jgi:hypothetical protein